MTGERLEFQGGEAGWDSLRNVEMATEAQDAAVETQAETARSAAGAMGEKVLEALDASKAETQGEAENPKLELMRKNWGSFEGSRELFGEKTEMVPYEYWIIAENMPWD